MNKVKLIGPFKQLVPMTGLALKGALTDDQLEVLEDVGIIIEGDTIKSIGKFAELKSAFSESEVHELKLSLIHI